MAGVIDIGPPWEKVNYLHRKDPESGERVSIGYEDFGNQQSFLFPGQAISLQPERRPTLTHKTNLAPRINRPQDHGATVLGVAAIILVAAMVITSSAIPLVGLVIGLGVLAAGCGDPASSFEPERDAFVRQDGYVLEASQKPDAFVPPIGTITYNSISCGKVPVPSQEKPKDPDLQATWTNECKIDLVVPLFNKREVKAPLLLWFPAGGYSTLHDNAAFAKDLALKNGWAVGVVKYYLASSKEAPGWPYAYISAKLALAYMKKYAPQYGVDASSVVAAGFSAGGTMAGFLGVTSGLNYDLSSTSCDVSNQNFKSTCLAEKPDPLVIVAGAVSANGPMDFTFFSTDKNLKNIWHEFYNAAGVFLGISPEKTQPPYAEAASPITYASSPAALLPYWAFLHGEADNTVPMLQPLNMAAVLLLSGAKNVNWVYAAGRIHNRDWPHPDGGTWLENTLQKAMVAANGN